MATTISDATLTVTVVEDVTLGGVQRGSRTVQSVTVGEYAARIMAVQTSFGYILKLSGARAEGTYIAADVKYLRITNKDTTNFIELLIEATNNSNESVIKLKAGETFMLGSMDMDAAAGDLLASHTLTSITGIQGKANTAPVDIELVIASS